MPIIIIYHYYQQLMATLARTAYIRILISVGNAQTRRIMEDWPRR